MSTDASAPRGQISADGTGNPPDAAGARQPPHALIQESIKYRRRAQDAERRVEALEAEVNDLQANRDHHAASLEAQLDQARAETETLRDRLAQLERDRHLEHELAKAGAADTETALALARQRLAGSEAPDDLAAFATSLLDEKPHLRRGPGRPATPGPPALPTKTAGARPVTDDGPQRAAHRLADRARQTGHPGDVLAYMRARRGVTA